MWKLTFIIDKNVPIKPLLKYVNIILIKKIDVCSAEGILIQGEVGFGKSGEKEYQYIDQIWNWSRKCTDDANRRLSWSGIGEICSSNSSFVIVGGSLLITTLVGAVYFSFLDFSVSDPDLEDDIAVIFE